MIEFRIKEKTRSLNESFRGDWRPRAAAAKRQRTKAMQACPKWPSGPLLVVRLTRVSPRALDFGNLAGALKHVQDGVASRLKIDDASPLVEWRFEQATGEAEVVVQIWSAGGGVAPPLPVGRAKERNLATSKMKGGRSRVVQTRLAGGASVDAAYYPPRAIPEPVAQRLMAKAGLRASLKRAEKAAREAEETFAPTPCSCVGERHSSECITTGQYE